MKQTTNTLHDIPQREDAIGILSCLFRSSRAEVLATLELCAVSADAILSVLNKKEEATPFSPPERSYAYPSGGQVYV